MEAKMWVYFMVPSAGTVCATLHLLSYFFPVAIAEAKSMQTYRTVMWSIMTDGVSHGLYQLPGSID